MGFLKALFSFNADFLLTSINPRLVQTLNYKSLLHLRCMREHKMYLLSKYFFVILNQDGQFKPTFSSLFKKTKKQKETGTYKILTS